RSSPSPRRLRRRSLAGAGRMKVAIVVSHPIQHFCPLYRALAQSGQVTLRVLFGSTVGAQASFDPQFGREVRWQPDLLDGFEHGFLPGAEAVQDLTRPVGNRHLWARLDAFDPDVVQIYGFMHHLSRVALAWTKLKRRRLLYVADSELRTPRTRAVLVRR